MFRKLRISVLLALCAAAGALLLAAGCATSDAESDLPWNMSQPWESSPGLPGGFNNY
jgi:hypothetical protein